MKTHLVTGCARGVGLAITEVLLARGDRVLGSVRDAASTIQHNNFLPLVFDVRDENAIRAAAHAHPEPLDTIINNAGIIGQNTSRALETNSADFAEVLEVNVLGPLRVMQAFLPHLQQSGNAKIMTVSSQMGGMAYPGSDRVAYRASKAAVNKLMQGVASDLAKENIAVVVVHPGWVRTDMGGAHADISAQESATGLISVLDALTLATTGRFVNWDGTARAW